MFKLIKFAICINCIIISMDAMSQEKLASFTGTVARTPDIHVIDLDVRDIPSFTIRVAELSNYSDKLYTWTYNLTFTDGSTYAQSFVEPFELVVNETTFNRKPQNIVIRKVPGDGTPVKINCEIIAGMHLDNLFIREDMKEYVRDIQYSDIISVSTPFRIDGKDYFPTELRLPNHIVTNDGTIVAVANNCQIDGKTFNSISISKDHGKTWCSRLENKFNQGMLIYDNINDVIWSFSGGVFFKSMDHGETFVNTGVSPISDNPLKEYLFQLKSKENSINKTKSAKNRYSYILKVNPCPTTGVQLTNGVLAVPFMYQICKYDCTCDKLGRVILDREGFPKPGQRMLEYVMAVNTVVYSTDYGNTWHESPPTPYMINGNNSTVNESAIFELSDNQLALNSRAIPDIVNVSDEGAWRCVFTQYDYDKSIKKEEYHISQLHKVDEFSDKLWDISCQASCIRIKYDEKTYWLFCNCYAPGKKGTQYRKNLMLQVSDDYKHWEKIALVSPCEEYIGGYCSLFYNNGRITLCYEASSKRPAIRFVDITEELGDEIIRVMQCF